VIDIEIDFPSIPGVHPTSEPVDFDHDFDFDFDFD
jgi:hypothetical protein